MCGKIVKRSRERGKKRGQRKRPDPNPGALQGQRRAQEFTDTFAKQKAAASRLRETPGLTGASAKVMSEDLEN